MAKPATMKSQAEKLCRTFTDATNYTLARKLKSANNEALTFNAAILQIRRVRGKQGKAKRAMASVKRTSKPSSNAYQCPPSAAEPWVKIQIDGPCKVLSLSDIHIPYHSKEAVEAAVAYGRKLKPDVVLLNGDTMDFYRCSRYQQDLRKRTLTQELMTGREFLGWIRGRFPKSRIIYKLGNHDQRWDNFVWNRGPEIFDFDHMQLHNALHFDKHGIERVDDNAVMAGLLPILHGHEIGRGVFSPVNAARGLFLRTKHTGAIGHFHTSSSHAESDMWHKQTVTWSQGCLCDLTPEYARVNRWNHGFFHVEVAANNRFDMHNKGISEDFEVRAA